MSSLLKSNLVVAAGTALSRLTGLGRTLALTYVLGRVALADAYNLANETPNIIYDLIIGGVLSATLVPLFTSTRTDDGTDDRDAVNAVITTALIAIVALTLVAVALAPWIFSLYSLRVSDTVDLTEFRTSGTILTRVFLVQILFYGISGIANAYLHSRRQFFAAAWSPVLSNVVIIATLLSIPGAGSTNWALTDLTTNDRLRWTLGIGATAGIAVMALTVVPAMYRSGFRFTPKLDLRHRAVKQLVSLSGWTIGFVVANQLALMVIRNIATSLDRGAVTSYMAAFIFFVLPHGLLAVSISTTFQPELATAVKNGDTAGFARQLSLGVRLIAMLTLPAGIGLVVLREPVIGLLKRGQFDTNDVLSTAPALAGLAIGLVGFSVYLFVLRGFYAHNNTRTPFFLNVIENALNVVFALIFVRWWGLFGLGLAYSVAYLISAVLALVALARTSPTLALGPLARGIARLVFAALVMGGVVWVVSSRFTAIAGWAGLIHLSVCGVIGVAVYLAVLVALKTPELVTLRSRARRP